MGIMLWVFLTSFFVSFLVTPMIRAAALRFYFIEQKSSRKMHNKIITKMGGLAIYAGFLLSLGVAFLLDYYVLRYSRSDVGILMMGSTMILLLGVYDDVRGADAFVKLSVQLVVAGLMMSKGLLITAIVTPFGVIEFGVLSYIVTAIWILGVTNAINLIDGKDRIR